MRKILVVLLLAIFSYSQENIIDPSELEKVKYVNSVMKVYSQTLSWKHPNKWKGAYRNESKNAFIMEFIPKEQELETWSDMLTIQSFKNLAQREDLTANHIKLSLVNNMKNISSSQLVFKELSDVEIYEYTGVMFLLGLKKIPNNITVGLPKGVSELGLYIVIKGKEDFYIIHRSWKRDAMIDDELPFSKKELKEWINIFKEIELY